MIAISRIAVGALLLLSGIVKARAFETFRASVRAYEVMPTELWNLLIASVVVVCELLVGLAIIAGWFFPASGLIALFMLVGFSCAVATALLRGKSQISCGCMNLGKNTKIGWYVCVRNCGLACLLVPSLWPSNVALIYVGIALLVAGAFLMDSESVQIHSIRTFQADAHATQLSQFPRERPVPFRTGNQSF